MKKILVIDDEEMMVDVLKISLEELGHQVTGFHDPEEGEQAAIRVRFDSTAKIEQFSAGFNQLGEIEGDGVVISAAGIFTISGAVSFTRTPSGRVNVDLPEASVTLKIPDGSNSFSGKLPHPNSDKTDGPLATLHAARDKIRLITSTDQTKGAITVSIRAGLYPLSETLNLTKSDTFLIRHLKKKKLYKFGNQSRNNLYEFRSFKCFNITFLVIFMKFLEFFPQFTA